MTPTCPVRYFTTPYDPVRLSTTRLRPAYDALRGSSLRRPQRFQASLSSSILRFPALSHSRSGSPAVSPAAALAVSPACSLAVCPPLSWSTSPRCRFRYPSAPAWFGCAVSSIPASQPPSLPPKSPLPLFALFPAVVRSRARPSRVPRALFPFLHVIPPSLRPSFPPPRRTPFPPFPLPGVPPFLLSPPPRRTPFPPFPLSGVPPFLLSASPHFPIRAPPCASMPRRVLLFPPISLPNPLFEPYCAPSPSYCTSPALPSLSAPASPTPSRRYSTLNAHATSGRV
ncbi:unnamed protein product [Closterium sp. NIES-65]|nr:unnamed protein product [Closterium sp. NIES-65]